MCILPQFKKVRVFTYRAPSKVSGRSSIKESYGWYRTPQNPSRPVQAHLSSASYLHINTMWNVSLNPHISAVKCILPLVPFYRGSTEAPCL